MVTPKTQRIFGKILAKNLAGNIKPLKPIKGNYRSIGAGRALPKGVTIDKFLKRHAPPPIQGDRPQQDLASYALFHSTLGRPAPFSKGKGGGQSPASVSEDNEPGLLTRIFDGLSAFGNVGLNQVDEAIDVMQGEQGIGEAIGNQIQAIGGAAARITDIAPGMQFIKHIPGIGDNIERALDRQGKHGRTFGRDVLKNAGMAGGWQNTALGLGLDIATDPLNAIPFVGFGKLGIRGAGAAGKLTAKATGLSRGLDNARPFMRNIVPRGMPPVARGRRPLAEDILGGGGRSIGRNAFKVPRIRIPGGRNMGGFERMNRMRGLADTTRHVKRGENSPLGKVIRQGFAQHAAKSRHLGPNYEAIDDLPSYNPSQGRDFFNYMRDKQLAKANKVRDAKGNISVTSVERAIDSIRKGDIPRTARDVPTAVNPESVSTARNIADNFLDTTLSGKKVQGKKITFTPKDQVSLFNKIYASTMNLARQQGLKGKEAKLFRDTEAVKMLRSAEDHLIRLGKQPQYWNGQRVRLSDVLSEANEAGGKSINEVLTNYTKQNMDQITDLSVKQSIETALARRSLTMGEAIGHIGDLVANNRAAMLASYKVPNKADEMALMKTAEEAGRHANLSPKELTALKDVVRQVIDVDKLPPEMTLADLAPRLTEAVASGRTDATVIKKTLDSIGKMFGTNFNNIVDPVTGNGAVDAFMATFTTWHGKGQLKRFKDDVYVWGERNAEDRASLLRSTTKNYTKDQQRMAWSVATGKIANGGDENVDTLANIFTQHFERMLGSSGFSDELMGGTVAAKAQVMMHEINKELARIDPSDFKFQFKNKAKVVLEDGTVRNYSQGADWLKSWELANPKDPAGFLYNMDLAMERVTKKYAFIDNFGGLFGKTAKDVDHTDVYPHDRLKGLYFNKEVRDQFARVMEEFDQKIWRLNSPITRWIARGTRWWKQHVTIYNPVHHTRNMIGDSWLMWMDGINDPRVFLKSTKVLATQKTRYQAAIKHQDGGLQAYDEGMDTLQTVQDARAMEVSSANLQDVIIKKGKHKVTAEQIWIGMHQRGLLLDANRIEDIFGEAPMGKFANIKPFGGHVHGMASKVSEYREHYVRTAHFTGALNQELKRGRTLKEAMDEAAHRVRKWHPDGRDLTNREQTLRLVIPFYSWLRKSTPLVLQSLVTKPAKIMVYPRMQEALQEELGIEGSIQDPFPDDQLFPDWVRAGGIGPLGRVQSAGSVAGFIGSLGRAEIDEDTGETSGYTLVDPGNPFNDFVEQFGGTGTPRDPLMGVAESINPGIRIPIELATGREFSGAPISNDPGGYAAEQVPFLAPSSRIFNYGLGGDTKQAEDDGTNFDKEAFINWFTGAGVRGTGPYIKQAEFEARERATALAEQRKSERGK